MVALNPVAVVLNCVRSPGGLLVVFWCVVSGDFPVVGSPDRSNGSGRPGCPGTRWSEGPGSSGGSAGSGGPVVVLLAMVAMVVMVVKLL